MGLKRRLIAGTINRYPAEEGWENVHLDKSDRPLFDAVLGENTAPAEIVTDLADLFCVEDESFDEVRCWQVLEHLTATNATRALAELHRVLKPAGVLDIEVPDLEAIVLAWLRGEKPRTELLTLIYGDETVMQDAELNAHRWAYTPLSLREALHAAGFDARMDREDDPGELNIRFRARRG